MKQFMLATAIVVAATGAALAQAPAADDPHHPPQAAAPAPTQPTPPAAQPGMGAMPMMNMMGSLPMMTSMTGMMQTMRMMGPGMASIDHVEGRIAFLRTELKITEPQTSAWNVFADALRANAKKLGEARGAMMPGPGAGRQQAPTMTERLDLQERWLLARLETTRTIKSAFTSLYGTLSDDQKKMATELLAPHMGVGMGMMSMMAGQMPAAQMMQPGQMMTQRGQMMQPPPTPPSGK